MVEDDKMTVSVQLVTTRHTVLNSTALGFSVVISEGGRLGQDKRITLTHGAGRHRPVRNHIVTITLHVHIIILLKTHERYFVVFVSITNTVFHIIGAVGRGTLTATWVLSCVLFTLTLQVMLPSTTSNTHLRISVTPSVLIVSNALECRAIERVVLAEVLMPSTTATQLTSLSMRRQTNNEEYNKS
jgi:hypothetical protein